jgi:hypothetical protein
MNEEWNPIMYILSVGKLGERSLAPIYVTQDGKLRIRLASQQ